MKTMEIERPLAGLIEKPKLQQFGSGEWKMKDIPKICSDMGESLKDFDVPDAVMHALASLDEIEKNNGILVIQQFTDLASMFMILSHPKANKIKEIRHKNWSVVDTEEIIPDTQI